MKLNKLAPKKNLAQAMVEFAIVLPMLLLLLYGLLETGRLLFMYSTIVTASRQAVRYGSATGNGNGGIPGNDAGVARYDDCTGIRVAANNVDFLNAFDHTGIDVTIGWDHGPANPPVAPTPICPTGAATDGWQPSGNTDRLIVTVTGHFNPIVPKIVPFIQRTITATSARTILTGVEIEVTTPPGSGGGPAGALSLTMSASPANYGFVNDVITYSYTVTNNGTVDLTGLAISPTVGTISCPAMTLAAGASMTCTGTYQITAADIVATSVVVQATATASDGTNTVTSNTATSTVTFAPVPKLTLTKTASREVATTGATITYTFTLINSGNVDLTGSTISDSKLGGTLPSCGGDLAVGASITCTADYAITANDVKNKSVNNTATATATYNTQTITSDPASATVYTGPLYLKATAAPESVNQAGQVITYTYILYNNTIGTLYPIGTGYPLTGGRGTDNCATSSSSLAPGGSLTCTGTYTVQQSDLDASITTLNNNNISAKACLAQGSTCNGNDQVTSSTATVSVSIVQNPFLTLQVTASAPPTPAVGSVVTYTYTLTNGGNVTLSSPTITDTKVSNAQCTITKLNPGVSTTTECTGTYTVTQADIDLGSITSQANASTTFNGQTVSASSLPVTVFFYSGPRLNLQIIPTPSTFTSAGQIIIYTYKLTNTGSVPLNQPYHVTDPTGKVQYVDCGTALSPLPPGTSTTCVGSYTITQTDLAGGFGSTILISAIASAGTPPLQSNTATATLSYPVPICNNITASIAVPGTNNTMTVTINNPNAYAVTIANIVVSWNATNGHQGGSDHTLILQSAGFSGAVTPFWSGPPTGTSPATLVPSATTVIPAGASTIVFTFDKVYDKSSGEAITINLSTPGCESTPIHTP